MVKQPVTGSPAATWIMQAVVALVCLGVPVLVTFMAPVTTLEYRKSATGVDASVVRYVLLVVPWRTQHVTNVTALRADVTEEFRYKNTKENRMKDRVGHTNLATGQVALMGDGPEVIVQAQPGLAEELSAEFAAFAAAPSETPVRRTVYASWSLSYLLGGAMTGLFALYVFGAIMAALNVLRKRIAP
jgi:hypothetical protein